MMKRIYILLFAIVSLLAVTAHISPQRALAVEVIDKVCGAPNSAKQSPEFCADDSTNNVDTNNPIYGENGVVTRGIRIFLIIFGIVAVFVLLINAVRMITSMGDSKSFESARNGIIYAAVGIAVAVLANVIVSFIVTRVSP